MSYLVNNHFEMESYPDVQSQSEYRSAYMTIINFLTFVDNGKSFTEKYLRDRFSHRLHYRIMLEKMIANSILKKSDEGSYVLNLQRSSTTKHEDSKFIYF